jgi:hypothetical protein
MHEWATWASRIFRNYWNGKIGLGYFGPKFQQSSYTTTLEHVISLIYLATVNSTVAMHFFRCIARAIFLVPNNKENSVSCEIFIQLQTTLVVDTNYPTLPRVSEITVRKKGHTIDRESYYVYIVPSFNHGGNKVQMDHV